MAIELAPGHKAGLVLANPVILAAGSVGCGEAVHAGLRIEQMGAVVVGPLTEANRAGSALPRVVETHGGIVLETGAQNRGVRATLREFRGLWASMGVPVIVHLADTDAAAVVRVARQVEETGAVAALEVGLASGHDGRSVRALLAALVRETELPVLARLPLQHAASWSNVAAGEGVSALVIGSAPEAAAVTKTATGAQVQRGLLYGPAVFAQMLRGVVDAMDRAPGLAVIACGGIHTVRQAREVLLAGAVALQLDSIAWIEPEGAMAIAVALAEA